MNIVEIDADKCNNCQQCVDACPSGVFSSEDDKVEVTNMQECSGCQSCVELCKECAITLSEI